MANGDSASANSSASLSLPDLQALHHELFTEKKRLSGAIGRLKRQQEDCAPLIAQMRETSEALARLESRIDAQSSDASADTSTTVPKKPTDTEPDDHTSPVPSRFLPGPSLQRSPVSIGLQHEWHEQACRRWDAYVVAHPLATPYHQAAWRQLISRNFAHDVPWLEATDATGNLVGVLPLVHLQSRLFGSFLTSLPYVNYGGPLADNDAIAERLMQEACTLARSRGCSHAQFRETHSRDNWQAETHKVSMLLALPESNQELESRLSASVRNQVKKAQRAMPAIRFGGVELLDDFYRVFSRNMRDLGTPIARREFFSDILTTFSDSALVSVVSIEGKPVSTAFLIGFGDTLEIPWASTLRSANRYNANMFLYREVLAEAIERGYRHFDFGRSTDQGPTYRFKKQWGAQPHRLHWHQWTADGLPASSPNPDNPKFRLAIRGWQQLPVWVANRIGPPIVRNLP